MAGTKKQQRSTTLASRAHEALAAGQLFDAERAAVKALMAARSDRDFQAMAAVVPTLLAARLERLKKALATRRLTIVQEPISEDAKASPGCFLIQPPQVAADARRLRLAAFEQNVSVAVLCREPLTQLRLQPIVAIAPGATVRTKVRPPKNADKPDMSWFVESMEALGAFAIQTIDPEQAAERRVDALMDRLDALSEHEGLHHALQQACLEAHEESLKARPPRSRSAVKGVGDEASTSASELEEHSNEADADSDEDQG